MMIPLSLRYVVKYRSAGQKTPALGCSQSATPSLSRTAVELPPPSVDFAPASALRIAMFRIRSPYRQERITEITDS